MTPYNYRICGDDLARVNAVLAAHQMTQHAGPVTLQRVLRAAAFAQVTHDTFVEVVAAIRAALEEGEPTDA